jgi:alkanesulfonate monooxygenase
MSLVFHWFLPTSGDGRGIFGGGRSIPLIGDAADSEAKAA